MVSDNLPAKVCPSCGERNPPAAVECASCGEPLPDTVEPSRSAKPESAQHDSDAISDTGDPLEHVNAGDRVAIRHFDNEAEADLACGLLRSSGIPAELAPTMIPGLSAERSLWVPRQQAKLANELLGIDGSTLQETIGT